MCIRDSSQLGPSRACDGARTGSIGGLGRRALEQPRSAGYLLRSARRPRWFEDGGSMNEIWNPEYETMPRDELHDLQLRRLQMTLRWSYKNVPFYRLSWDAAGFRPDDITTLDDLKIAPFTVKEDFRKAYPYDLFAVPLEQVVRIHSSTGTTSRPIVVGYTRGDLNTWAELCARVVTAAGARPHDVAQVA